ncbi:Saccharopine dehydrogenase, NADP-dependent [Lishizhenia tianjinensis]|uniref:Saccharopine dehydrogenase, NADP-dependent n=1 Tax=Lishizhenia tianjinensis TaxID=477690 RepID=A0A1I6ZWW2_9FLAO|nr:saccharopine dehydrogenase C-terminal domain-containing protein [Lishizhenia tianjinensis]SFT67151.1 Saccharopine dehydrogenase, NADP-dependent [Lishizhenia tianjinensis]
MKQILILGAGLSSSSLIRYLLNNAEKNNWFLNICDQNIKAVEKKINGSSRGKALSFNALDPEERKPWIQQADIVISMLPARFHVDIAKDCITYTTDLITPSYVSPEMEALSEQAKEAGIIIMNEIGVDPGIDHMSAMRILDQIHARGGKMHIFESFCGGLVAPESDDNPWNYKFTWNPRNVVLAGQGGAAKFIQENKYKYIPYHKLFRRTEIINIDGYGLFEGYANRDSLSYRDVYGLHDIPTIYRGTLRRKGFSRAWDVFVQLGATDDSYILEGSENMTNRDFINSFLPYNENDSVELKLRHYLKIDLDDTLWDKLVWLDIFDCKKKIGLKNATPAQILQHILEEKWTLKDHDKDMIVMYHKFVYVLNNEFHEETSEMVNIGENQTYTSMSNTVGLPVGICTKLMLNNSITRKGVLRPIYKEIYDPILDELEEHDIKFIEKKITPPRLYSNDQPWS